VDTVGGLLATELGKPAQVGDAVAVGNVRLEARRVSGLTAEIVRITYSN
jgi:CBS domain containing-hemolysin-like protein